MAFNFLGTGTTYAGLDREPDGKLIATEWLQFLYLPILPLRSSRVESVRVEAAGYLFIHFKWERVQGAAGRVPLRRQVSADYWEPILGTGLLFVFLALAFGGMAAISHFVPDGLAVALVMLWLVAGVLAFLRVMMGWPVGTAAAWTAAGVVYLFGYNLIETYLVGRPAPLRMHVDRVVPTWSATALLVAGLWTALFLAAAVRAVVLRSRRPTR